MGKPDDDNGPEVPDYLKADLDNDGGDDMCGGMLKKKTMDPGGDAWRAMMKKRLGKEGEGDGDVSATSLKKRAKRAKKKMAKKFRRNKAAKKTRHHKAGKKARK